MPICAGKATRTEVHRSRAQEEPMSSGLNHEKIRYCWHFQYVNRAHKWNDLHSCTLCYVGKSSSPLNVWEGRDHEHERDVMYRGGPSTQELPFQVETSEEWVSFRFRRIHVMCLRLIVVKLAQANRIWWATGQVTGQTGNVRAREAPCTQWAPPHNRQHSVRKRTHGPVGWKCACSLNLSIASYLSVI